MLADVDLRQRVPPELIIGTGAAGFAFLAPLGRDRHRVVAWSRDAQPRVDDPPDLDETRCVMAATLGSDLGAHDASNLARFHSDERQARRYRAGPILLAGDAAHVHSPVLGQGLNTGLADAAELSARLAASLRHDEGGDALDGYERTRHPIGRQVLRSSRAVLTLTTLRSAPARALRNLFTVPVGWPMIRRQVSARIAGLDAPAPPLPPQQS